MFEEYLRVYPDGQFAGLAALKIDELRGSPGQTSRSRTTHDVAVLDGPWKLTMVCSNYTGSTSGARVSSGKFEGTLHAARESFQLIVDIDETGAMSGYGGGAYVDMFLRGYVTDWDRGQASGTLAVSGHDTCDGSWKAWKTR